MASCLPLHAAPAVRNGIQRKLLVKNKINLDGKFCSRDQAIDKIVFQTHRIFVVFGAFSCQVMTKLCLPQLRLPQMM